MERTKRHALVRDAPLVQRKETTAPNTRAVLRVATRRVQIRTESAPLIRSNSTGSQLQTIIEFILSPRFGVTDINRNRLMELVITYAAL